MRRIVVFCCCIILIYIGIIGFKIFYEKRSGTSMLKESTKMYPFPSYLEYQGLYNTTLEDWVDILGEEAKLCSYFQSVEQLPPLTWEEFWDICSAVEHVLVKYGRLPGMSEEQAKIFYKYCVDGTLRDRTVQVDLPRSEVLTPQFVEQLQREVLGTRPLWRILIMGVTPDTVVIIYPKVVRVGTVPPEGDWKAALAETVNKVEQIREMKEGPQRRQLAYLRPIIPAEIRKLQGGKPRLVAAFDTFYLYPERNSVVIWFLYPTDKKGWFDIDIKEPKGCTAASERIAIKEDGTFDEYYDFNLDHQPAFWLKQYIFPDNFQGRIVLEKLRHGRILEEMWTYEFDGESIIKDSDLRIRLSSMDNRP